MLIIAGNSCHYSTLTVLLNAPSHSHSVTARIVISSGHVIPVNVAMQQILHLELTAWDGLR
jgi:hypothetical protein